MQVLNKLLTRLLVEIPQNELANEPIFEVTLARSIATKLIEKVGDLYCCTVSINILLECFVRDNPANEKFREQLFTETFIDTLFKGISTPNLNLPSYNQKTRYLALCIFQQFTMQKKMLLQKIQHPIIFVQNTLAAVEEEKDPRNLMISFDLIYFIISEYFSDHSPALGEDNKELIEQLHESIFDSVSCYYPINFKPPKNNTFKITPDQLKNALNKCILASDQLCHIFIPFLLEKLGASQIETKLETLSILTQMVDKFSIEKLKPELSLVLSQISNMYFNVVED